MDNRGESARSTTGDMADSARHCPERGRGRMASATESEFISTIKPVHKLFYLYLGVTLFVCFPKSINCVPLDRIQSPKDLNTKATLLRKVKQYYNGYGNTERENTVQQLSLKENFQEHSLMSKLDDIRAEPVTFKAEITFGFLDMKDFIHGLMKGSTMAHHHASDGGAPLLSHQRSSRDTAAQMSAASDDGPWVSNLSPAAVVGTIVGGTVGIFVIVVLTAIFCSYRNYPSLEVRQRTADVYGGRGGNRNPHHAERRV